MLGYNVNNQNQKEKEKKDSVMTWEQVYKFKEFFRE